MSYRPIFVLGLARSGTNLLARMLDRHPKICLALDPLMPLFRSLRNAVMQACAPEDVRRRFKSESPFQDFYFDAHGPAALDTLLQGNADLPVAAPELSRLQAAVEERAALESPELGKRLRAMNGRTYGELLESALEIVGSTKPGAAWVGCKEVWVFDFVPLLARALPEARFYAIERDPRAILASLLAMAQRDASQAAHPPSYMRHWRKSIALSRMFELDPRLRSKFRTISYEALVAEPAPEARRICADVELDYVPDMLSLSAEGWAGNSSFDEGKDVYASSTERWRKSLAADVRRAADCLCAPEMTLTRYRPDSTEGPARDVEQYLRRAESAPASWRSSSGNPAADFAGEVMRHELLRNPGQADPSDIRRCFLFSETFTAIRKAL